MLLGTFVNFEACPAGPARRAHHGGVHVCASKTDDAPVFTLPAKVLDGEQVALSPTIDVEPGITKS